VTVARSGRGAGRARVRRRVRPGVEGADGVRVVDASLWSDYEAVHAFVHRSSHGVLLRRRARWCLPQEPPTTCLWLVDDDVRPDVEEALCRLGVRWRFDARGLPERPRRRTGG
jgi:Domain of unknown function (DUF3291)